MMSRKLNSKEKPLSVSVILHALLLLLLLLPLVRPAGAQEIAKSLAPRREAAERGTETLKDIPEFKVAAPSGSFAFSNLRLVKSEGSAKLLGTVSNETGESWQRATFELKVFDEKGKELKGAERIIIFQANDFHADSSAPLDEGYGVRLEGIPFETISRVEAIFAEGRRPATYRVELQQPTAKDDLKFEDDALKASFDLNAKGIDLNLLAKTNAPIVIDWDEVKLIDPSGKECALEHHDVSLSHGLLAPLTNIVLPENAINTRLVPESADGTAATFLPEAADAINYKGKSIRLLIPLELGDVRKSYDFVFKIKRVEAAQFHLPDKRYRFIYDERERRRNEADIEE